MQEAAFRLSLFTKQWNKYGDNLNQKIVWESNNNISEDEQVSPTQERNFTSPAIQIEYHDSPFAKS